MGNANLSTSTDKNISSVFPTEDRCGMVVLYLLVFLILFKIRWGMYDLTLVSAAIAGYIVLKGYKILVLPKFWFPLLSLVGVYVYAILSTLINMPEFPFYLLKFSRVLVSLISTYIIILWVIKRYPPIQILYALGITLAIHPSIMYLELVSAQFSNLWIGIQETYNPGLADLIVDHRTIGLLNGHPPAGNFLGISSLYFMFMLLKFRSKLFFVIYIGIIPLFPASGVLGMILYLLTFFTFLAFLIREKEYFTLFSTLAAVAFITILSAAVYISGLGNALGIQSAFDRLVVIFNNDVNSPSNPVVSFYATIDGYNIPPNTVQFLFGNLEPFSSAASTAAGHAGIIVNLHAFGIVGLTLLLFSVFTFVGKSRSSFLLLLTTLWLVLFLKNDHIYSRIFFDLFFICFILAISGIDEYEQFFDVYDS